MSSLRHLYKLRRSITRFTNSLPNTALGQQAIFNVSSGDVLDKGKVYGELDVTFKPDNDADNVFTTLADYYTSKHAIGYSIGNTNVSNGNHFFYTAVGVNFN